MFTGIIESTGKVFSIKEDGGNKHFEIEAPFVDELAINQSIAHNGACLSVSHLGKATYKVIAIKESLDKTNLDALQVGDIVNLERCMKLGDRLDGHIVQGHVDCKALCKSIEQVEGSWVFGFEHPNIMEFITVEKGSICVNGVSLTVVGSKENAFSVAIIPYTYEHTNFSKLKVGDYVNLEFDILGKYIAKLNKN